MFLNRDRAEAVSEANRLVAAVGEALSAVSKRSFNLSRIRTSKSTSWGERRDRRDADWSVSFAGIVHADVSDAARVVAAIVGVGVELNSISWRLDKDNPAYREVRKEAVLTAVEAAQDFAEGLGMRLADVVTLVDSDLLGSGASSELPEEIETGKHLSVLPSALPATQPDWDAEVGLDPEDVLVSASVEATFKMER